MLISKIENLNVSKESRSALATEILDNPTEIEGLIKVFQNHKPVSHKAAWILEIICRREPILVFNNLNSILKEISSIDHDSSRRCIAKIFEILTRLHESPENGYRIQLNALQVQEISEFCFDTLINKNKAAAKAFAMTSLANLSQEITWIKPELLAILKSNYANETAAYKARARVLISKLENS